MMKYFLTNEQEQKLIDAYSKWLFVCPACIHVPSDDPGDGLLCPKCSKAIMITKSDFMKKVHKGSVRMMAKTGLMIRRA